MRQPQSFSEAVVLLAILRGWVHSFVGVASISDKVFVSVGQDVWIYYPDGTIRFIKHTWYDNQAID